PRGPVDLRGLQGATESTVQTESRGRPERTASEARRACRDCLAPMGLKGLAARQVKTGRQAPLVLTAMMVRPRTRWQSLQGSSARKPNGSTPSWEKRALGVLLVLMVPTELKVPEVRVARKASRVCRVKLAQQALRSEEHTSELQSRFDIVCRLLLETTQDAKTATLARLSISIKKHSF